MRSPPFFAAILSGGRYTAGSFDPVGNRLPYSPVELYLAGLVPPDEVPEVWVANDGAWSGGVDASGNRVFTASDTEMWSIERVIEENGTRTPSWLDSQKTFRAATMLIVDDPARSQDIARELSEALRVFSVPGPDGDPGSYNFWEATGGRATLATDRLGVANRPPELVDMLPPLTLGVDGAAVTVEVSGAFRDPDGDRLTYGATSSSPAVAMVAVAGSVVTVTPVSEGTASVMVAATDTSGLSASQPFGVTVSRFAPFTDDPLQAGVTTIKAVHLTELRMRIDSLRREAGQQAFSWTDSVLRPGVTPVRRVHLLELREALTAAYVAAGRPAPRWTDPAPVAGTTPIRATHVTELRAAVLALE